MDSSSDTAVKRRLACDRCHSRKLRCSRGTTGCARCMNDGHKCIYSPALKVGRPSKASRAAKDNRSERSRTPSDVGLLNLLDIDTPSTTSNVPTLPMVFTTSTPRVWSLLDQDEHMFFDQFDITKSFDRPLDFELTGAEVQLDNLQEHGNTTSDIQKNRLSSSLETHDPIAIDPSIPHTYAPEASSPQRGSLRSMADAIQRLACAQQELLQYRSLVLDASRIAETTILGVLCNRSVDAVLKPGQETLDIISSLLRGNCPTHAIGDIHCKDSTKCSDWRTALHFMLTPLSLFLSTYRDILHEIRAAIPPYQPSPPFLDSRRLDYQQTHPPTPTLSKPDIFDTMDIRLGNITLDRPLQLILLTTVLEYHLSDLDNSLRTFQCQYLQSFDVCMSEGLLSSSVSELRSSTKNLLSATGEILRQSQK